MWYCKKLMRRLEMPTSAKKKPTWAWIYGDEFPELWEHFGFPYPDPDDRMKVKFVKYESFVHFKDGVGGTYE
tara:strand:+ start:34 stop:249 length:216 start_codon:yes stop_codon:yes gene_type:complete